MILVLTHDGDVHTEAVSAALDRQGVAWQSFDPVLFPASACLSVRIAAGTSSFASTLRWAGHECDLGTVTAVYYRRPGRPRAPGYLPEAVAEYVAKQSGAFVEDVFDSLDVLVFPGTPPVIQRAQAKVRQLALAVALGFEVPDTAVGNDSNLLVRMFTDHNGQLVSKAAGVTAGVRIEDELGPRFTEPVRPRDLVHAEGLRACPVIVQARVPKKLELRVTVVGERVFAAAIHSQATHRTRDDWRRYDHEHTPVTGWTLPHDVERRCVALVRELEMHYGALDLVLTPDERYVFLEINPSGQYLWIERATGLPISEAIAEFLATAGGRGRAKENP